MACNTARLCERTAGRRVPALPGGGLLRITPHCMRVTVWRARSCRPAGGTLNLRLVHHRCGAWRDMESAALPCGRGGSGAEHHQRGQGGSELCDALEVMLSKFCTLTPFSPIHDLETCPHSGMPRLIHSS